MNLSQVATSQLRDSGMTESFFLKTLVKFSACLCW